MEFGVVGVPGIDWIWIWVSIGCVASCILAVIAAFGFNAINDKGGLFYRYGKKDPEGRPLKRVGISDGVAHGLTVLSGWGAFFLFVAIWPFLGVGLDHQGPKDCLGQEYASPGAYHIVEAELVYPMEDIEG